MPLLGPDREPTFIQSRRHLEGGATFAGWVGGGDGGWGSTWACCRAAPMEIRSTALDG